MTRAIPRTASKRGTSASAPRIRLAGNSAPATADKDKDEESSEEEEEEEKEVRKKTPGSSKISGKRPGRNPGKASTRSVRKLIKKGSIKHRNWLARANRIGSKLEVFNESPNHRGTTLRTVSRLQKKDLDKIPVLDENGNQKTVTVKGREYDRTKVVYKSRHVIGKMIHEYTHVEIENFADLEDRKRSLRDYFMNESKSGEAGLDDSAMYQKYLDIKTQAQLNTFNAKVREKEKVWTAMNKKMRTYFTETDENGNKKKKWDKPSNSKKIRLRGHLSTSGEKIRNCLANLGTSESCAKEDCEKKEINAIQIHKETGTNQGGKKYCVSPSKKINKGREDAKKKRAAAAADDD